MTICQHIIMGVYKTWARPWPTFWPTLWPTLCGFYFTNYKENNNYSRARGSSVVNSSDSRHFVHETRPQGVLPVIGGRLGLTQDAILDRVAETPGRKAGNDGRSCGENRGMQSDIFYQKIAHRVERCRQS